MSSRNGTSRADIDVGLMHDPKVLRLARHYRDPAKTSTALMLYVSAVLSSWDHDEPVSVADAAPGWFVEDVGPWVADLATARLVDDDGRVPASTLDVWMAGVRSASERGRSAAHARWSKTDGTPSAMHPHSTGNTLPASQPSGQNARASARREKTAPVPLSDLIGSWDDITKGDET